MITLIEGSNRVGPMPQEKKTRDLMIRLEDFPHVPYWFTLSQSMAIIRESRIKFEGQFGPRMVLVFDEKYRLVGLLNFRDIIKGLEPKSRKEIEPVQVDLNSTLLIDDLFGPGLKDASQKPVSEVMRPIKVTIQGCDPIASALSLMIEEDIGLMPVMEGSKVIGIIRLSDFFKEIADQVLAK